MMFFLRPRFVTKAEICFTINWSSLDPATFEAIILALCILNVKVDYHKPMLKSGRAKTLAILTEIRYGINCIQ